MFYCRVTDILQEKDIHLFFRITGRFVLCHNFAVLFSLVSQMRVQVNAGLFYFCRFLTKKIVPVESPWISDTIRSPACVLWPGSTNAQDRSENRYRSAPCGHSAPYGFGDTPLFRSGRPFPGLHHGGPL